MLLAQCFTHMPRKSVNWIFSRPKNEPYFQSNAIWDCVFSHRIGVSINKSAVGELGEKLILFGYIFLPINFS